MQNGVVCYFGHFSNEVDNKVKNKKTLYLGLKRERDFSAFDLDFAFEFEKEQIADEVEKLGVKSQLLCFGAVLGPKWQSCSLLYNLFL